MAAAPTLKAGVFLKGKRGSASIHRWVFTYLLSCVSHAANLKPSCRLMAPVSLGASRGVAGRDLRRVLLLPYLCSCRRR
ncbi:hypothetical protein E2C01_095915 [Portunus trituberculatus]|uniref:Uncharacterized protein n=1 Tax=Portunus trituberculatus TaxID=210409 RepID=A0A5B7JR41_PORTR|nr:hypothetical protein [Portunus trituberculatus]